MNSTKLDIINLALINLGSQPCNSLDDDTKSMNAIRYYYEIVKQGELRSYNWNFAISRAKLPAAVTPVISDVTTLYEFPVPTDFLKLLYVDAWNGQNVYTYGIVGNSWGYSDFYRLEGSNIISSAPSPLFIKYIYDADETEFDPLFVDVLACALSIKLADLLTQDTSKLQSVAQMYQTSVRKALRANAFEVPRQYIPDHSFVLARF